MNLKEWIWVLKKHNRTTSRNVKIPKALREYWNWEVTDSLIKGRELKTTSTLSCIARNGVEEIHVKEIPLNVWSINTKLIFSVKNVKPSKGFSW